MRAPCRETGNGVRRGKGMILNPALRFLMRTRFFLILAFLSALFLAQPILAQTTLATGSIQGRITDPRGGALNAVKITFTSKATGAVRERSTNPSGLYTSGALIPGYYDVKLEAKGFQTEQATMLVQVGITRGLDVKLFVRAENKVPISQTDVQIYSEQPTVQGVITAAQVN